MDRDLASVQEARDLVRRADEAQRAFARATQETTDRVVEAMGRAASAEAERLARLAVDETGMFTYPRKSPRIRRSDTSLKSVSSRA